VALLVQTIGKGEAWEIYVAIAGADVDSMGNGGVQMQKIGASVDGGRPIEVVLHSRIRSKNRGIM